MIRVTVVSLVSVLTLWALTQTVPTLARRQSTGAIRVDAIPVPLNPRDPGATSVGDFRYAGGVSLTAAGTDLLHGLSDLTMTGKDTILAVGDMGVFFETRLIFDSAGRLTGVADSRVSMLTGLDGQPLTDKAEADAEGLALMPNGDRLVSFERHHRIWLYPKAGGRPRAVPSPDVHFASNEGMEALTAEPESAADAYMVGAEESGETWRCRIATACVKGPRLEMPQDFGLVAINHLPQRRFAYLIRAYDPVRGARVRLRVMHASTVVAEMDLAAPFTVDNFEGLTSAPGTGGKRRFYILSDDNASSTQRTLLLAFDWMER